MQVGQFTLDDFQVRCLNDLRQKIREGHKKVCLCLRTGGGKTIVSAAIMQLAMEKGSRCLFLANRRLLIGQKSKTLDACGLQHAILMDGHDYCQSQIVVASRDSFHSRVMKKARIPLPDADIVIVDELHSNLSGTSEGIYGRYPKAVFIGLTATPARGDGRGLGKGWAIVSGPSHAELVDAGRLVDLADPCYAPRAPDLSQVPVSPASKDYVVGKLSQVMDDGRITGDAVEHWRKYGQGRPTVAFCCDVAHSIHTRDSFIQAGFPWGHVDANTPDEDRQQIYADLKNGRILGCCNVGVLTEGWDYPGCSCAVLLRPTKSLVLFLQMVGRVLRADPSTQKQSALLIDHAGNLVRHGWPTIERDWPESDDKCVQPAEVKDGAAPEVRHCPECAAMWVKGPACPACGWKPATKRARAKCVVQGELVAVSSKAVKKASAKSDEQKLWLSVLAKCAHRGLTIRAARSIFQKDTGKWPDTMFPTVGTAQFDVKVANKWPSFVRRRKK